MLHLYANQGSLEICYNVETVRPLTTSEFRRLKQILSNGLSGDDLLPKSGLKGSVLELGPRSNFATAFSTHVVSVCRACGLDQVIHVEPSRRYQLDPGTEVEKFIAGNHDRMTECVYPKPIESFVSRTTIPPVRVIHLLEKGPDVLTELPGLAMDEADTEFYYEYFRREGRNPTDTEIYDLNNANSEHSRHGYFKGKQVIDGKVMPETLMEIVQSTHKANPTNTLLAFTDNSAVIRGWPTKTLVPLLPGKPSRFGGKTVKYHITITVETHNHPSAVEPYGGASTGPGGGIRDGGATGQGAELIAATTGYATADPHIPGNPLPWEKESVYPSTLATPLQILIRGSDGASDYGNRFGEPVIAGFVRTFDQRLPNGERWAFIKPILFTGRIGQIDEQNLYKAEPEAGMLIIRIGGPAYRIGFGGGASSSLISGQQDAQLDFDSVQRGDPEMEKKDNCVIRSCFEMGKKNPIILIHDQGAGGPGNVLKELVEKMGGRVELRKINLGDPTMSVTEIWVCEYQEGYGLVIRKERLEEFLAICDRERVPCEVLGEVTGDGRFIVHDELDGTTPVNLDLSAVLGGLPQKTFSDDHRPFKLNPFVLPEDATLNTALHRVFQNPAVGSKRFLTSKVDRSVTGKVVRQQCCGPLQLPVADNGVVALSLFDTGLAATSIGEQPIKMLVNPKAGARMAVAEALTNMASALITDLHDIKCSANWMWPAKLPGEGAALYDAAVAMRDLMIQLGISAIRGKDSLTMAAKVGDEIVKSPRQLVISAVAPVPDAKKIITPDIKRPGKSSLIFLDISRGKARLGGSILAQVYNQIGNESPDIDEPLDLKKAFYAVQELISKDLILSCHDISDGGLITCLLEMAFAGNCGLQVEMIQAHQFMDKLFAEEAGFVLECGDSLVKKVLETLNYFGFESSVIGKTIEDTKFSIVYNSELILDEDTEPLWMWWEETSYQFERLQKNPQCADEENFNLGVQRNPGYEVSFKPRSIDYTLLGPGVAILRDEGSNGDREMSAAFRLAGFDAWDVNMTDLLTGKVSLDEFQMLAAVGGFTYSDHPGTAKGWAATILFNDKLRKMFEDFFRRKDTLSLGVCNGCQLFTLMGWVPFALPDESRLRMLPNVSRKFESRWVTVEILKSPAVMLREMAGSVLGIWVAHGEGRLDFPDLFYYDEVLQNDLAPIRYVMGGSEPNHGNLGYPFNPNGSAGSIAALCTEDGRHLAMMPHPERAFLKWQWPWMPEDLKKSLKASPWLKMFQNAREWCENNK